jgi:hypothetical protein
MPIPSQLFSALLSVVLGATLTPLWAAPRQAVAGPPDADYVEQAYLSDTRYVSQFFDFTFELPPEAQLRAVPQPAARDGSIQLLEMAGPPPVDAAISISAIPVASGRNQDARTLLRYALDQELYRGVEELRALSKAGFGGHQFYFFETRRGIEEHMLLATTTGDYILRVVLASHDDKTLKRLEWSFQHLVFFAPAELRQYLAADARPYDGPAISSHRLALLESDPPASHIDPGKVAGDFYENPAIGFSYRIPQGWVLEANGAVQPAIERDRAKGDFGKPRVGRTEYRLLEACSRTLFSAWAKRPDAKGMISYDDFGEVTVSALASACFPRMKFPQTGGDQQAARDFLLQFSLSHPIVQDMRDAKLFSADGSVFLYLHGTVGFQVPDDELSRRLSLAMVITERHGYLLAWFFAAPHDQELKALTDQRVIFDPEPPVKVARASSPGGGEATADLAPPATAPATAASGTAASAASASGAASSAGGTADSNRQSPTAASTRPTLLRPGETMESQQGKGAPLNKQRLSQ